MNIGIAILLVVIALTIGLVVGVFATKFLVEKKQSLSQESLQKAILNAQNVAKEAMLSAKEQIQRDREKFDRSVNEQKNELKNEKDLIRQEKLNIKQKEDALDKRQDSISQKNEKLEQLKIQLVEKESEIALKELDVGNAHQKMLETIEKAANMTRNDAKQQLILAMEEDAKRESVKIIRDLQQQVQDVADVKAREIIASTIQRCGVEYASELSISTVVLPNDEMKGRIIGREGRNIRALEQATGIDFVVDDTPEAIVLSGFDPVRREIARLTLEKLISDGRIHPTKIEETVEKMKREVDTKIKQAGEAAVYELGIFGMHPEIVKTLGRLKYRTSYGQNQLTHSIEVARFAGQIAAELGADINVAKRGALLHDLGKAIDYEVEGTHTQIGVDLARKHKESEAVIHCIEAHHFDIEMETVEAVIVQIADALSGSRPGARRESFGNYVQRLENLERIASSYKGVEKCFAVQAGREVRIIVKPDEVDDTAAMFLAKDVAKQIESEMQYPGHIKVNVIRELRMTEYAK
ncbi:MAG: ribonuclease Y [Clostridiales bacterium]|nr:ribonuclease Y [Clostridiales bacterium]